MKNNGIEVGTKFYKYLEDNTLEVIRVIRKKGNEYIVKKDGNVLVNIKPKTEDDLHEYTLLRADAIYNFAIVTNAEGSVKLQDVVVIMARKNDKEPYAVCRQMMNNLFTQMVTGETVLGSCLSQDTCPPDVKFNTMLMCSSLEKKVTIHGYLNDTPKDIMDLAYKFILQADKILTAQKKQLKNSYKGLCDTTQELLCLNGFWEDINKGLKITELNDKIENCSLNDEQLIYLENHISYLMDEVHVLEYGHDIDFAKIKSDYMLIRDLTKKLYLVNYLRGSFIKQEHLSEEELAKFTSIKI